MREEGEASLCRMTGALLGHGVMCGDAPFLVLCWLDISSVEKIPPGRFQEQLELRAGRTLA